VSSTPADVAAVDQADATFAEELDTLVLAIGNGIAARGAQQARCDFGALFARSDRFDRSILAALLAQAIARLADGDAR